MTISLIIIGGICVALLLLRQLFYTPLDYESHWLDSPETIDPALTDPSYLVSNKKHPTNDNLHQPVLVLVHGFTASSYEFNYFKAHLTRLVPNIQYSTVVLGGHGRDYNAFKKSTAMDWGQPIKDEVNALIQQGYQSIYLLGVSTGGTLLLNQLLDGNFTHPAVRKLLLVDPYLIPKDKLLYITPYIQWLIPNTVSGATHPRVQRHWYTNRPLSSLAQLLRLLTTVQSKLRVSKSDNLLPVQVFVSKHDPVADARSVTLLQDALGHVEVVENNTNHHVIIEPSAKDDWSETDKIALDQVMRTMAEAIQVP
ncbi:MAG: alpha/beta hydrolase [Candidatus Marinamargulisbacteria bacterium]